MKNIISKNARSSLTILPEVHGSPFVLVQQESYLKSIDHPSQLRYLREMPANYLQTIESLGRSYPEDANNIAPVFVKIYRSYIRDKKIVNDLNDVSLPILQLLNIILRIKVDKGEFSLNQITKPVHFALTQFMSTIVFYKEMELNSQIGLKVASLEDGIIHKIPELANKNFDISRMTVSTDPVSQRINEIREENMVKNMMSSDIVKVGIDHVLGVAKRLMKQGFFNFNLHELISSDNLDAITQDDLFKDITSYIKSMVSDDMYAAITENMLIMYKRSIAVQEKTIKNINEERLNCFKEYALNQPFPSTGKYDVFFKSYGFKTFKDAITWLQTKADGSLLPEHRVDIFYQIFKEGSTIGKYKDPRSGVREELTKFKDMFDYVSAPKNPPKDPTDRERVKRDLALLINDWAWRLVEEKVGPVNFAKIDKREKNKILSANIDKKRY